MKISFIKRVATPIVSIGILLNVMAAPALAQEAGDWSTSYPTYDTGSWSTTYPTYDTGSWSTTQPTYDTGSWSTTYPTYDTGSWSTTYPTYDTGSWSTTYPTYDTGSVNYGYTNYGYTNYNYTSPVYTTPTYTTPTYIPPVTTPVVTTPVVTTPVTTTVPVVNTVVCSDGLAPINGSCVRTTTVPTVNTVVCSDGFASVNGSCVRTNTIPTTTNVVCSDGSYPVNGSCVRTVVAPTVTYQTCWDGSTIPLTSVCPAQYKTCPNGTSIPVSQTCYFTPAPAPAPAPVEIKFNNVITSVATEITNTSARCNGIGLIASGAPSTGWFEYGETPNLGRETAHANIGSAPTSPFSNKLVNLKSTTTYYCRAVMQNQYGTVKGEVVALKTKSTAVSYVKPVTTTTTKKTTKTTTTAKQSQITCVDGTVVSGGSTATTNLINSGQKLISLQMDKVSGDLATGAVVNYKLGFKNLSDQALKNVTLKVTVPPEVTFMQASSGAYDPATRTLTATIPSLPAGAEGAIGWAGTVGNTVAVGTPVAVTGYAGYTVPGTNAQDEVTAYTTGTVTPPTTATSTGAKTVIGATSTERGFLPNTLVEWLALIAIIFIIFILGRSVYVSYKEEKVVHH